MKAPDPAFERPERQVGNHPGAEALLAKLGRPEVFASKHAAVEQVPAAPPMRLRLLSLWSFGDQHKILDQRGIMSLRPQRHEIDVVRADHHDCRGEQLVGKSSNPAQSRHVSKINAFQFLCTADQAALVWADLVTARYPVLEERPNRGRVEPGDVVAFQKRVHDQLPVRRDRMGAPLEQVQVAHPEPVEIITKFAREGEVGFGTRSEPDQPTRLATGQLAQAVIALVEAGKGFGSR